jgi:hypothetical protein
LLNKPVKCSESPFKLYTSGWSGPYLIEGIASFLHFLFLSDLYARLV